MCRSSWPRGPPRAWPRASARSGACRTKCRPASWPRRHGSARRCCAPRSRRAAYTPNIRCRARAALVRSSPFGVDSTFNAARAASSWQARRVPSRPSLVFTALLSAAACLSGCWQNAYLSNRGLHYVDGELVETPAPAPAAYESYLRARLALERTPPQLDDARGHILDALRWQPDEPQLWTVKAEIEWR